MSRDVRLIRSTPRQLPEKQPNLEYDKTVTVEKIHRGCTRYPIKPEGTDFGWEGLDEIQHPERYKHAINQCEISNRASDLA